MGIFRRRLGRAGAVPRGEQPDPTLPHRRKAQSTLGLDKGLAGCAAADEYGPSGCAPLGKLAVNMVPEDVAVDGSIKTYRDQWSVHHVLRPNAT